MATVNDLIGTWTLNQAILAITASAKLSGSVRATTYDGTNYTVEGYDSIRLDSLVGPFFGFVTPGERFVYMFRQYPKVRVKIDADSDQVEYSNSTIRENISTFTIVSITSTDETAINTIHNFLTANATKLPDTPTYTYTVKSSDGATELATVSAPSITAAQFTDGTLTLTDADGSTHIASWTSAVPEGMKLLGLAYTQGATSADIPIGEAVSVLWEVDTVLYEIYAPIVATITYKGSVIAELNGGETKKLLTGGKYLEGDLMVEAEVVELWDGTGVIIVVANEYGETVIINSFTEEANEYGTTVII